jgi:hypothetical protein
MPRARALLTPHAAAFWLVSAIVIVAAAAIVASGARTGDAAFPGQNGQIAFARLLSAGGTTNGIPGNPEIYAMRRRRRPDEPV